MFTKSEGQQEQEANLKQVATGNTNPSQPITRRSSTQRLLGKLLILLTLVSFIFVGLILNLVQLILTLTIRLSNNRSWRRWHKQLNGQIVYAVFSQPVFLLYVWPRWQLDIVLEDMKLMEDVKENIFGIIIANHTFELDWMTCFVLADQLGNMGNYKCFSKDELKWLPIIGWTFWMADLIYVKRDWKHDRLRIADKLDQLLDYNQILLGIFAEGTRWTEEKHEDAVKFAESRSIEPYKYHLFPRPRGFNYTLRHYLRLQGSASSASGQKQVMNTGPVRVFNLEIIMPDRPKFKTFLEGGLLRASVYCEEVHLSEELRNEALQASDEDNCPKLTKLLQDIFRRKDQLVEEFTANGGRFPLKTSRAGHYPIRKPTTPLIYWLIGMSLTYGTFTYLACTVFAGSLPFWTLVVVSLTSGVLLLKRIEYESLPTKLIKREQKQQHQTTGQVSSGPDANGNTIGAKGHSNCRQQLQQRHLFEEVTEARPKSDSAAPTCELRLSSTRHELADKNHHETAKPCDDYKSSQAC